MEKTKATPIKIKHDVRPLEWCICTHERGEHSPEGTCCGSCECAIFLPRDTVEQKPNGAVRSADAAHVRFDLICPTALTRLAMTYAEGAQKYGDVNWTKGLPIGDTLNHSIRHIELYLNGDATEDHLSHAAWGLLAVIHYTEKCQHHVQWARMQQLDQEYLEDQKVDHA